MNKNFYNMELIDKSALVVKIEEEKRKISPNTDWHFDEYTNGYVDALKDLLSFLNTLEVRELDLDFQHFAKEMTEVYALPTSITENTKENPLNWEYAIAKHFYELGLKAKGE